MLTPAVLGKNGAVSQFPWAGHVSCTRVGLQTIGYPATRCAVGRQWTSSWRVARGAETSNVMAIESGRMHAVSSGREVEQVVAEPPSLGVIALVPDAWQDIVMPRHQVLQRLANHFPVVWIEPALNWREY